MNFSKYILALVSCLYALTTYADVTINSLRQQNVEDMLLDQFIGSGVEISNATFNGEKTIPSSQGSQIASFDNSGCIVLDIKTGIMMGTAHLSDFAKGNESFRFNNIDLTYEELYEFAWGYLPMMLNKEFKEKEEYIDQYEDYYHYMTNGIPTDKFNELLEILKTDDLLVTAFDYRYDYYKDYEDMIDYYEYEIDDDREFEKIFPYYAIYKITRSFDLKYYNNDPDIVMSLNHYLNT